ncbi:hypothetical protein CEXT_690491 [Caerostris extrusa]|uniref:Uncharacterized protein n=1 Tax=Caerostris extrusa TaxID=172846 RepID=A0AAV4MMP4_CAEEX|nr:hypothetical protein CEXT_690491 [Caerostris extrusa]
MRVPLDKSDSYGSVSQLKSQEVCVCCCHLFLLRVRFEREKEELYSCMKCRFPFSNVDFCVCPQLARIFIAEIDAFSMHRVLQEKG